MRLARAFVALVSLATSACVEEQLVLGDDRSRHACQEAETIVAPEVGCTTLRLESSSPYGCLETGLFGGSGRDHAGSWVRLARRPDQSATLRVSFVGGPTICSADGGSTSCPATAYVRTAEGTPCTCDGDIATSYPLGTSIEVPLDAPAAEVLLEPLGGTFEVSVCASGPIGP